MLLTKKAKGKIAGATKVTFHAKSSAGLVKNMALMAGWSSKSGETLLAIDRGRSEVSIASSVDGLQ